MHEATNILRREHVAIMVMVHVLEEMLARLEAGEPLSPRDLPAAANYFVRFADRLHHAKEELVLFPAFVKAYPAGLPLVDELLAEHQRGRALVLEMLDAAERGAVAAYGEAARCYVQFIRAHVATENDVLFPLADAQFSATAQLALAEHLTSLQAEVYAPHDLDALDDQRRDLAQRYLRPPA